MGKYDVVWWWRGGREHGEWCEALPGADIAETIQRIERAGYVAVRGSRLVGPPEGAPVVAYDALWASISRGGRA